MPQTLEPILITRLTVATVQGGYVVRFRARILPIHGTSTLRFLFVSCSFLHTKLLFDVFLLYTLCLHHLYLSINITTTVTSLEKFVVIPSALYMKVSRTPFWTSKSLFFPGGSAPRFKIRFFRGGVHLRSP